MEEDIGYMGDQLWNKCESIGDDEKTQGPKEDDHYNTRHGLKKGMGDSFSTILQCIFKVTCIDRNILKDLLHNRISMREWKW